jgi:hypothetical protein
VLDGLLQARYTRERAEVLRRVNLNLERPRFGLAKDLHCLSLNNYGFAARSVEEIGKMVGGWLKTIG